MTRVQVAGTCAALVAIFVVANSVAPYDDLTPTTTTRTSKFEVRRTAATTTATTVKRTARTFTVTPRPSNLVVGVRLSDGTCVETGPVEAREPLAHGARLDERCKR